nr:hypothetical protein [Tanacetum cinerariifolium]
MSSLATVERRPGPTGDEQELLQTTRDFHSCKQIEGQLVSSYVLKMKGYIDNLEHLGNPVILGLGIHEKTLPKNNAPALHAILAGKVQKVNKQKKPQPQMAARGQNHGKEKNKLAYSPKPKIFPLPKREDPQRTQSVMSVVRQDIGRGIVLNGFINRLVNNTIQVFRNNMVYFSAILRDVIFEIDLSNSYTNECSIYAVSHKKAKLDLNYALLWHCHLGHIIKKRIKKLQHDGLLNSTDLEAFEKCVPCMSGKMARKPYTHQVERAKDLIGLTHTDVCGPFKIMSRQGVNYFITFTNAFSRYGYVYLLKHKHDVFETFKVFQKEVENQLERRNRTLLNMVRSMMSQTTLPKSFSDYELKTAASILNMVPTKKVEHTPYKVSHGQAPKLSYLNVWGCEALVKRDTLTKPDKLEPRSIKCIFIGYPKETMSYSFYNSPENKEDKHPSIDTSLNHEEDDLEIDEPQSDIIPIRRSTRTRHAPDRMCLYINGEEHELGDLSEPSNYKAELLDPESEKWINAMNVEMQSMKDNEVWLLVELPPTDIRAIRILIAIAAYYDDEI